MNDRELLELAAKAAGYEGYWVNDFGSGDYYYTGNTSGIYIELADGGYIVWNPLEDDGDALRLAVKLRMMIDHVARGNSGDHIAALSDTTSCREPIQPNPYAATRRAIVRAAAETEKEQA